MCGGESPRDPGKQREHFTRRWHGFLFESYIVRSFWSATSVWRMAGCFSSNTRRLDGKRATAQSCSCPLGFSMIWEDYVFRRGIEVEELWDHLLADIRK